MKAEDPRAVGIEPTYGALQARHMGAIAGDSRPDVPETYRRLNGCLWSLKSRLSDYRLGVEGFIVGFGRGDPGAVTEHGPRVSLSHKVTGSQPDSVRSVLNIHDASDGQQGRQCSERF